MVEATLVLFKPDVMHKEKSLRNRIIDDVINRYMTKGLDIYQMEEVTLTKEQVEEHYKEHKGKHFYNEVVDFMTDTIIKMIVVGEDAIKIVRTENGPTNVLKAREESPNSIRAIFGNPEIGPANVVHASDSLESAKIELNLFYSDFDYESFINNINQEKISDVKSQIKREKHD